MLKRISFFVYGTFSYLIFLGTFLYAVGFIGNFGVPTTLDGPANGPLLISFAIDAGLLTLFALKPGLPFPIRVVIVWADRTHASSPISTIVFRIRSHGITACHVFRSYLVLVRE